MKKPIFNLKNITILITLLILFLSNTVYGHCEIPCGIYGDSLRVALIKEHITTIDKSMKQIASLSQESTVNYNQIVRWITKKITLKRFKIL